MSPGQARVLVQIAVLAVAMLAAPGLSILPYVLPLSLLACAAGARAPDPEVSPVDMFWLLMAIFFVLAPAATLTEPEGSLFFARGAIVEYPFGARVIYPQHHLILLFTALFIAHLAAFALLPAGRPEGRDLRVMIPAPVAVAMLISLFLADIALRGGWANAAAPRLEKSGEASLFAVFSRAAFMAFALVCLAAPRGGVSGLAVKALALVLTAILFNPFNVARFMLLQAWLPILLILLPGLRGYGRFCLAALAGLVVVLPVLSLTSRFGIEMAALALQRLSPDRFLAYLDASHVLLHLQTLIERDGHSFGASLGAILFFFVPRTLWPGKPEVLGAYVGDDLLSGALVGTANLSGPVLGDLMRDFGMLGVVVGSVLLALGFRQVLLRLHRLNGVPVLSFMLIAQLPILYRGSVGAVLGPALFSLMFYWLFVAVLPRVTFRGG